MLVLIGCSPSSGSTFLADLLDSVPGSLCGSELGLFSNTKFYEYKESQKNPSISSYSSSIYWLRSRLYKYSLEYYGLDEADIIKMAGLAQRAEEFSDMLLGEFARYRKQSDVKIWFETTPVNTNCIGEYLDTYPDGKFIYLVRNPVYVYMSLLNRNYSNLIAATNWLVDIANYYKYRNNKKVYVIK